MFARRNQYKAVWTILCLLLAANASHAFESATAVRQGIAALNEMHGADHQKRIQQGVEQVAQMWTDEDGSNEEFVEFVGQYFIVDEQELQDTFDHFEYATEIVDGHFVSMGRELRHWLDVDVGPILPVDRLLGAWDPAAHVAQDYFLSKIAFVSLLNFRATSLQERLDEGDDWTRSQWAEARLNGRFDTRIPANVQQQVNLATTKADAYIAGEDRTDALRTVEHAPSERARNDETRIAGRRAREVERQLLVAHRATGPEALAEVEVALHERTA